jgi:hypothetical protein
MTDNDEAAGVALILIIIGAGIGIGFLAFSFENLGENEYGLKVDVITRNVDPIPKRGGGLHFVGAFYDYIRFPATWVTVEFIPGDIEGDDYPVITQTKDGLAITFDASFQYKLKMESLYAIYMNYSNSYSSKLLQIARGSLRNTASKYSATQFLQNRENVSEAMRTDLWNSLTDINVDVEAFQLRTITLPASFMNATEQVEVAKLKQVIAQYELQAAVIAAQIGVVQAQALANISLIDAYAASNVTHIEALAQASALNISRSMESTTLADLMAATGMNASHVLAFLYIQALENLPPGTTLVLGDFLSILVGVR